MPQSVHSPETEGIFVVFPRGKGPEPGLVPDPYRALGNKLFLPAQTAQPSSSIFGTCACSGRRPVTPTCCSPCEDARL